MVMIFLYPLLENSSRSILLLFFLNSQWNQNAPCSISLHFISLYARSIFLWHSIVKREKVVFNDSCIMINMCSAWLFQWVHDNWIKVLIGVNFNSSPLHIIQECKINLKLLYQYMHVWILYHHCLVLCHIMSTCIDSYYATDFCI